MRALKELRRERTERIGAVANEWLLAIRGDGSMPHFLATCIRLAEQVIGAGMRVIGAGMRVIGIGMRVIGAGMRAA